ncbi:MAG: recombination mediator RecR [Syntrophomonadaceae bacterium]|nr:recombination mediator RecR [Syntrophomonadaceae bacterium]
MRLARPLERLIDELSKLPGIGPKSAQRLALHLIRQPEEEAMALARAIVSAVREVYPCPECGNLTDVTPCAICQDEQRDSALLCVVEASSDILPIERTGYQGRYYVLNRSFDVFRDRQLDEGSLQSFTARLETGVVKEVILALNPTVDGDIMGRYLLSLAAPYPEIRVSRLAHGLPVGGDIEFADEITLRRALEGRREF